MKRMCNGGVGEAVVFSRLADIAIFNKGDSLVRKSSHAKGKGRKGEGAGGGDELAHDVDMAHLDDRPDPPIDSTFNAWHIIVAQTMTRVASAMQREILEGKLISYFTEWCDTPSPRTPGVCYRDYIVVYDREGEPTQYIAQRSPANNIYVGIDTDYLGFKAEVMELELSEDMDGHALRDALRGVDPVLIASIERYTDAMSRTFWSCHGGFEVQQACEVSVLFTCR
jgi:hypothetical protein